MAGRKKRVEPLTANQCEAARLHLMKVKKGEIARQLGVTPQTISAWFGRADFLQRIADLEKASDAGLLQEIRVARLGLFQDARDILRKVFEKMMDSDKEFSALDYATVAREHANLYKIVSAQTGVAEMKKVEVTAEHLVKEGESMLDEMLAGRKKGLDGGTL